MKPLLRTPFMQGLLRKYQAKVRALCPGTFEVAVDKAHVLEGDASQGLEVSRPRTHMELEPHVPPFPAESRKILLENEPCQ